MTTAAFIHQLVYKKGLLQRQLKRARETNFDLSDSLTRKIELINILLAEFNSFANPKSLKNLLKCPNRR